MLHGIKESEYAVVQKERQWAIELEEICKDC
jgi:hypothetical protein